MNVLMNFNEIIKKDVTYDNIKSCKKQSFHFSLKKYIFGKSTGGGQIVASVFLELINHKMSNSTTLETFGIHNLKKN